MSNGCDYGCNQARNCPAHQQPYPFTDITPTDAWRDEIEDDLALAAIQLVCLLVTVFVMAFGLGYLTGAHV